MKRNMILMILSVAVISIFTNCEKKGSMEKAGEQIDETVDKIQEKAKDAGNEIKDSVDK